MENRKTSSPYTRRKGQLSQTPLVRRRRKLWRSVKSSKVVKKRYKLSRIRKRYYRTQVTPGSWGKYRKRRSKQIKYRYVRKKFYYKRPSQGDYKPALLHPLVPLSVLPSPNDHIAPVLPNPPQFFPPEGTSIEVAPVVTPVLTSEVEVLAETIKPLPDDIQANDSTATVDSSIEQSIVDGQIRASVIEADVVPDPVFINVLSLDREGDYHFSPEIKRAEEDESVGSILKDDTIALLAQQVQGGS